MEQTKNDPATEQQIEAFKKSFQQHLSLSVAKNPLFAKKSLSSPIDKTPLLLTSMKANACLRLKYGLYLKEALRTSQALSHLNRAIHRFRNSALVSALKNWEIGNWRLI